VTYTRMITRTQQGSDAFTPLMQVIHTMIHGIPITGTIPGITIHGTMIPGILAST
jgi:hypothetical protein